MAHAHDCHSHAATIDVLPDDIFLEIFAFCVHDPYRGSVRRMREWQGFVHVCQRWRQIIYASPRYLDLLLYCSTETHARSLNYWPPFPIAITYYLPDQEDDAIALLKHPDRIRLFDLRILSPAWSKVLAAMQEPFPVLTRLEFSSGLEDVSPVLPGTFLGGSAPCLQEVRLHRVPFPGLPTLLLSACDLVRLILSDISPTGYISPEAMAASLAVLTRLETLFIQFQSRISPLEQRRRPSEPSMRAVLPALTEFNFAGRNEYLEDLVARFDAPRLDDVQTYLDRLDTLRVPQLSLFIGRIENLRLKYAQVEFSNDEVKIKLNRYGRIQGEVDPIRPHFSLSTSFEWPGTHVAHVVHVLNQTFAMFSSVGYLFICASEDHPGWQDDIDNTEWLAFFQLSTTVETLHVSGGLAEQVARALEDVPEEATTEVLPPLFLLLFNEDDGRPVEFAEQFVSLRRLYGRLAVIVDLESGRTQT